MSDEVKPKSLGSQLKLAPKPDGYAHGGVVQGLAKGGFPQPMVGVDPFAQELPPGMPQGMLERLGPGDHLEPAGVPQGMIDRLGDHYAEEVYGQGLGPVKAFGLGALRGATLSGSDYLLAKTGLMDPKDLEGYEKGNPGSSFAGEATGLVGSMFLAPEFAPAALIGKAGKAAQVAAKTAMATKGMSAAGRILADVGAAGAGSAIEGALYGGVQQSLHEAALGDPELTGQKVAANFAYGALFGGAFGSVLKGAEIGVPKSVQGIRDAMSWVREKALGTGSNEGGAAESLFRVAGASENTIEAFKNRAVNLEKDEQADLIKKMVGGLNMVERNKDRALLELNQSLRPQEMDFLVNTANEKGAIEAQQALIYRLNEAYESMYKSPLEYYPPAVKRVEKIRDELVGRLADKSPANVLRALTEAKQRLQALGFAGEGETANMVRNVAKQLATEIKEATHDPALFGLAGAAQSAHDDLLHNLYGFVKPDTKKGTEFQKMWMTRVKDRWEFDPSKARSILRSKDPAVIDKAFAQLNDYFTQLERLPDHLDNVFGSVPNENWDYSAFRDKSGIGSIRESTIGSKDKLIEAVRNERGRGLGLKEITGVSIAASHPLVGAVLAAYDVSARPVEYINKLAQLERWAGKTTEAVGKMAKGVFDPSVKVARGLALPLQSMAVDGDDHARFEDDLLRLAHDPMAMQDHLAKNTQSIQDVAPNIAASMQGSAARAAGFLATKIPKGLIEGPFTEKYKPSPMEIAKFNRYREIVENPLRIMEQVKGHTLTPEALETIQTVYPQLYDEMKKQLMEQASDALAKKKPVPYSTKQTLTVFMGEPMDPTLTFQHIMANQMVFQPPQAPMGAQKPSKTGMQKMSLAERSRMDRGEMED